MTGIDAAEAIETQALERLEVCRLRDPPSVVFVDDLDHAGRPRSI